MTQEQCDSPTPFLTTDDTSTPAAVTPLPAAQVRHRALVPSTAWHYVSDRSLRYLARQKYRAETTLGLEAEIVQDERGFVALWTGERPHPPQTAISESEKTPLPLSVRT